MSWQIGKVHSFRLLLKDSVLIFLLLMFTWIKTQWADTEELISVLDVWLKKTWQNDSNKLSPVLSYLWAQCEVESERVTLEVHISHICLPIYFKRFIFLPLFSKIFKEANNIFKNTVVVSVPGRCWNPWIMEYIVLASGDGHYPVPSHFNFNLSPHNHFITYLH